jgi:hypothetical protein
MGTAISSAPDAAAVADPLNITLDSDESDGLRRIMEKSTKPNRSKAARHSAAAQFAQHLKDTGHLPA